MSKQIDKLERSVGEFNKNYVKTRKDIVEVLEREEDETPQAHRALKMLDTLDAVLDDLVTTIKKIDKKTKKS